MPQMGGLDLLLALKHIPELAQVLVVLMSGFVKEMEVTSSECAAYIAKLLKVDHVLHLSPQLV